MQDETYTENIPSPVSVDYSPLNERQRAYDKACSLINGRNTTYQEAREAVTIIQKYRLTEFYLSCRVFVYFPDLLKEFLDVQKKEGGLIAYDDLGAMFCRCIEQQMPESMRYLNDYKGDLELEIKLLPGKYTIDDALYQTAKEHLVRDTYYDNTLNNTPYTYSHLDLVAKERSGSYVGFRDAYHILLYGGLNHLQSLIVRWDLWGDDCTGDAAREFFKLSNDCPISAVKSHVNRKCQ